MTIQTTPFAPETATDDDLAGYHAVVADAWAVDAPNDPPQPYAATVLEPHARNRRLPRPQSDYVTSSAVSAPPDVRRRVGR